VDFPESFNAQVGHEQKTQPGIGCASCIQKAAQKNETIWVS
jgi:hypothetical protein